MLDEESAPAAQQWTLFGSPSRADQVGLVWLEQMLDMLPAMGSLRTMTLFKASL
jgi:hypothetical protein